MKNSEAILEVFICAMIWPIRSIIAFPFVLVLMLFVFFGTWPIFLQQTIKLNND